MAYLGVYFAHTVLPGNAKMFLKFLYYLTKNLFLFDTTTFIRRRLK